MLAYLALLTALPATSRAACAFANLAPFTARYEVSMLGGLATILKIHNGILNRILFQVAMMRDMLRHHRPLDYRFMDKGRLKTFRFEIEDTEKVDTPLGTFETIKLRRAPTTPPQLLRGKEFRGRQWHLLKKFQFSGGDCGGF